MGRYFIKFSYIGTQYRGVQKNYLSNAIHDTDTVQGALECALLSLRPSTIVPLRICLSSRTDAGVHALCNTAHLDLENRYGIIYDTNEVMKHINRYMVKCQHSIRLLDFVPVTTDFSARSSVISRTYIYRLAIAKVNADHRVPIGDFNNCFYIRPDSFDIDRVKEASKLFIGLRDFTTFSAKRRPSTPVKHVRRLESLTVEKGQPFIPFDPLVQNFDYWHLTFTARSYLYNQVRRIVGALVGIGVGRITEKDIKVMLQVPGHHNWDVRVETAPARGLHLIQIEYDPEEVDRCTIK